MVVRARDRAAYRVNLLQSFTSTVRGLIQPRRAAAIAVVSIPMLYTQKAWSIGDESLKVGIILISASLLIGPTAWRWLGPFERQVSWLPLRLLLYTAIGIATVYGTATFGPPLFGARDTFLTARSTIPVLYGMFLVAGWGLGRDIDLELSVERERARAASLTREKEKAELLAVRSHLDPHFLFNTLNAIAEWCQQDPAVAEKALVQLADILRTVLGAIRDPAWPLSREITLCMDVCALHRIRDPERFVAILEGEIPQMDIPPMLLLPLVENAMKHGPGAGHRGPVILRVTSNSEFFAFSVQNPGAFKGRRPGGEGIAMVEKRLELTYGGSARLDIRAEGNTTVAEVRIHHGVSL